VFSITLFDLICLLNEDRPTATPDFGLDLLELLWQIPPPIALFLLNEPACNLYLFVAICFYCGAEFPYFLESSEASEVLTFVGMVVL
jgi:hypothetical protein